MHCNACKKNQNALNCVSFKNKVTVVAKPDLLGHFSQLFWVEHALACTIPQPQPPINSLQCTAMYAECTKMHCIFSLKKNLVGPLWPNLICQAIFLNCSELSMSCYTHSHCPNPPSIHCNACFTQKNCENWLSRFGMSDQMKIFSKWHFGAFCMHGSELMGFGAVVVCIYEGMPHSEQLKKVD